MSWAFSPTPFPPGLVDFPAAGLSVYDGCYAIVLDDLYSRPTLSSILAEAERQPWQFAQVNAGSVVYTNPNYRNGQRIIHDSFALSEQIFAKVRPHLNAIEEIEEQIYVKGIGGAIQKWRMVRLNERLRFLRYPKGGFFRPHEDGCYMNEKTGQRTFYTLQLYLPSDTSGSEESFCAALGGATRFWGEDPGYDEDAEETCPYADVEALPWACARVPA
ncbi:P4Hc domain-containing protein [Mycena venus]|uniref:P4Hc domain-containing protein n=1 Tax=Mycena venus TaxID=2733690 RepID=A0A8H6YG84_9AGAR|nr:P4Hc domain-containing protein [Mycena venus]